MIGYAGDNTADQSARASYMFIRSYVDTDEKRNLVTSILTLREPL